MKHYEVSILSSPLDELTYKGEITLKRGDIVEVSLRNTVKKAMVLKNVGKPDYECKEIEDVTDTFFPDEYIKIAKFISEYYFCSLGEALSLFTPFKKRNKEPTKSINFQNIPTLTTSQQKAYQFLQNEESALLFGDTGSGKTEIYIKLIVEVLKKGKSAIFLMPEISLTPQMEKRLQSVFGKRLAMWHSKVTKKRKTKILDGIYSGEIKLIAGARSALFLPLTDLGAIVVDEEHDQSYKSGNRPRYNARDLALYFGKVLKAKVVLGSATPSLTTYHRYPFFRLKGGYKSSKKEFLFEKNSDEISSFVLSEIEKVLKEKKQAIIFLPTRANYKYIFCYDCGDFIKCPFCSVGMSLHKRKNALLCHYCGYSERIPKKCKSCGSEHLNSFRMGTEEVKTKLEAIFKEANIAKFDRDAIKSEKELKRVLSDFNDKKIDILVGTQMLSKGHDYKDIKLAVILGIDTILSQNDFKARENALSLAVQIAGRSGRNEDGEVIIQTSNEDFFKKYLSDYEEFLKDELRYRKELYPPFKKLSRVLFSDKSKEKAKAKMLEVLECLNRNRPINVDIVGYGEANIERIASKYRYNILLRSTSPTSLIKLLLRCKKSYCEIDMDPLSFS